jgi:hypothetical protein
VTDTQTNQTTEATDRATRGPAGEAQRAVSTAGQERPLSTADIANGQATAEDGARRESAREEQGSAPLFSESSARELHDRWTDVQTGFVDEPRSAVEQADALVAEVMKRLADGFATERQALERQWSRGDDVSTEDLRVALRRYRSFFDRLLSI